MTFDNTPWAIGGGAEHKTEVARTLAYAATGGGEGIIGPADLKVLASPTPNGELRIQSGGVAILSRYPGAGQQTYVARNPTEQKVSPTATGSAGGRSDLIVARVKDPQYEGDVPTDPVNHQYVYGEVIPNVPATTTRFADLNLGYPAVELARIDIPASTGTYAQAMVTDLRKIVAPRSLTDSFMAQPRAADWQDLTTPDWFDFPQNWFPEVTIPDWATGCQLITTISGIAHMGWVWADLRNILAVPNLGPIRLDSAVHLVDTGSSDTGRTTLQVAGKWFDIRSIRGQRLSIKLQGRKTAGAPADRNGYLRILRGTTIVHQIEFTESIV